MINPPCGYETVIVVVSCVEVSPPYRAHPNKVVYLDRDNVNGGIVKAKFSCKSGHEFRSLQIESVAKSKIRASLNARKTAKVDPFLQGFDDDCGRGFDLGQVRLCFQVS